jgi:repressor LexA
MQTLTERQKQVLNFIEAKQSQEGITPTFREIAAHFKFSSPNAALAHVKGLRRKGYLKVNEGRARALQLTNPNSRKLRVVPRVVPVPIYGHIPAGGPNDAVQEDEGCVLIDVHTLGIKPTARTFGLRVRGDSMIGKHIVSGDIAILEHGMLPKPGDVVAALIDGQVTLKTYVVQRNKVYLKAENPRYPNLIPQEDLQIQGVMVAVVRCRNK